MHASGFPQRSSLGKINFPIKLNFQEGSEQKESLGVLCSVGEGYAKNLRGCFYANLVRQSYPMVD